MLRVCEAVFPSADVAVTVMAHWPVPRSSGGKEKDPSSSTSTTVPGSADGPGPALGSDEGVAGVADGSGASGSLPRKRADTVTVAAFVVAPSTAIAPLP